MLDQTSLGESPVQLLPCQGLWCLLGLQAAFTEGCLTWALSCQPATMCLITTQRFLPSGHNALVNVCSSTLYALVVMWGAIFLWLVIDTTFLVTSWGHTRALGAGRWCLLLTQQVQRCATESTRIRHHGGFQHATT